LNICGVGQTRAIPQPHDTTGMIILLGACLVNLAVYGDSEDVLEDLVEILDPDQIALLVRLADVARRRGFES
jgi:hypothetical protein